MNTVYTYLAPTDPLKFLCNLGRPTKRGIKKCPKCGIYNGTRGIICKNKECDAVLKDDKRKIHLDAVRLVGIVKKVYSVRVKDRGPDHRGFVLGNEEDISENALCFVDSCQRLFDDSILKCHEEGGEYENTVCAHIDASLKSKNVAVSLLLKGEVLKKLKVSKEMKEKLWIMSREKEHLVQKISRNIFAVKCQVSPKHPLGYLHLTFASTRGKEIYDKYHCSCSEIEKKTKCLHYYACICALASGAKWAEEFDYFINSEFSRRKVNNEIRAICEIKSKGVSKKLRKKKIKSQQKVLRRRLMPKILPVEIKVLEKESTANSAVWSFTDWLSYVTESINQTMHFENFSNLNTLVFCIPEMFYNEFKKRIPVVYAEETAFPPTYCIMNILHLKEIFDTASIKLKISRRFFHDSQKGFVELNEDEESQSLQSSFIYFLNVGQSTVDESDNTNNPFVIQWVADITSLSKVGQLKLQYKYGRKNTT